MYYPELFKDFLFWRVIEYDLLDQDIQQIDSYNQKFYR